MTRDETAAKLRKIMVEAFDVKPEAITEETNFIRDLEMDSLDTIELAMAIEDQMDVDITDEQSSRMPTFGAVVDFLVERARG